MERFRVKLKWNIEERIMNTLKGMAYVLTCLIMLSFFTPIYGARSTDVNTSDWFYDAVERLSEDDRGIIVGYPDGTFRPQTKLARDQFITMVVRALGEEPGNSEGYWAQNYIDKAMELGIVKEEDFDSYLGPVNFKQVITREEMCMIIIRAVERLEGEQVFTDLTQVLQVVTDSEDFSFKYNKDIMKTYKLGIITGYPDHTFKPQGVLTRAEASAVVVRLIDPDTRPTFDYEEQYNEQHSGMESHLLGGANWVDPVAASNYDNAKADWDLITSDMDYLPSKTSFELNRVKTQQSSDYASGILMYDENEPYVGHIEDFERLLQRRMPQDQVDIVMEYLAQKTDKYTYLKHDEAFFYLDNDRYLVRVDEVKLYDGQRNVKAAIEVNFNIWYRDQNFIDTYEKDITQIMPYTDVVIYR